MGGQTASLVSIIFVLCYLLRRSYWNSIECTDKSADNLFVETEKVVRTLMDQGANVICAVADNAPNLQKSLRKINEKYPKIVNIGCVVHTLNLLMGDNWKKMRMRKELDNLLGLIRFPRASSKVHFNAMEFKICH